MGTYNLEKEIHRILQDLSKIQDYNAKLRNEYIKINNEARQLKEVKSLQSVINSFPLGYFDKNNWPDGLERTDSHLKSNGEKNNKPESSSASPEQIILATISKKKISLGGAGNSIDIDKLLLLNLEGIMPKKKVKYSNHKKYIKREKVPKVPDRPGITSNYLPYEYNSASETSSNLFSI
ncbi:20709_t:CDS:2 [Cetraspora pellucida]|uniref:20709_t:CDS:1 n=1 Tax=Cetraspora pellucida TaxID=1433469 RepID=A0A9N9BZ02_9GLOM|nr:20709_t:CDS:2 [Cetraspora pellucida]